MVGLKWGVTDLLNKVNDLSNKLLGNSYPKCFDVNDLINAPNGYYSVYSDTKGLPYGMNGIIKKISLNNGSDMILTVHSIDDNAIWTITHHWSGWTNWKQVTN